MSDSTSDIREVLMLIFNKLEIIEVKQQKQEEYLRTCMEYNQANLESNSTIITGIKSTNSSLELLQAQIDELHQLTIALFNGEGEAIRAELEKRMPFLYKPSK